MTATADHSEAERQLDRARAVIAQRLLACDVAPTLGDITLRPHQRFAVGRLRTTIALHGGALLAEEAGTGKTYIGLAVAARYERVLVVAPAALRAAWEQSLRRACVSAELRSFERLSRAAVADVPVGSGLVIVDEAHHLRNVHTRRYASVAKLCTGAAVLLLTATPIQNHRSDLVAQLALFLGDAASTLGDDEIARFVVRRPASSAALIPAVDGPHWIRPDCDDDLLDVLVGLPPPVPAADEGEAHALVSYTLIRQWASSRAALVEALRRRLARAAALIASLESGRWPGRRELMNWTYADGALQLAFPELLGASTGSPTTLETLLSAVGAHDAGLRDALSIVLSRPDPDAARVQAIRELRARHAGARIIAFSQYADTVRALARRMLADGGVAELTARGARVAGGTISRSEVLAQLAPHGPEVPVSDRIDLLITTDVLSEGLDLQAASVVVHIDLPWNPARLEQRVGRVRRIGSAFPVITTYGLAPPASSERLLRIEERLRRKLRSAGSLVGRGIPLLPTDDMLPRERGAAELMSEMLTLCASWQQEATPALDSHPSGSTIAAVHAPFQGFLAVLDDERSPLLADVGDGPTVAPDALLAAVRALANPACVAPSGSVACATDTITQWLAGRRARRALGLHTAAGARVRSRVASRIAAVVAAAPRHERPRIAALASPARERLRSPLTAGLERALTELSAVPDADEQWLREVVSVLGDRAPIRADTAGAPRGVLALIVFCAADAHANASDVTQQMAAR